MREATLAITVTDASANPPGTDAELARIAAIAGDVPDPEIPVLNLEDLGVLRGVERRAGDIVVRISPTYIGCPAVAAIELSVEAALREAGYCNLRIERVLSPPWSTDEITPRGRERLRAYGIAPPQKSNRGALFFEETVACPRCGSHRTTRVSEFGSTACKALWRCDDCREPFDYFKCL